MTMSVLAKKLQLKPGNRGVLFGEPANFRSALEPLPDGAVIDEKPAGWEPSGWEPNGWEPSGSYDYVHIFAQNSDELRRWWETAVPHLKPDSLLWIAYPKKSAGIKTDLTRDEGWAVIFQAGFSPVRQIAIDETWSALRFRPAESDDDGLLAVQYAGEKAQFRPIYDHLVKLAQQFGPDVELTTRKSYVALARGKQFAVIVPSTKTRLDLGLKLLGKPTTERLKEAKNLGSGSITHKVALHSLDDVDEEVIGWLKEAYDNVG